ncbi:uncharacterized protein EV422DRAFT_396023 [Fimicolochytrium jonesii]|uniref:uncharacterized protein n=1 Tax=Fimicolochytrium jonesii TaxID=1396493 RepID=UPI0022FE4C63|nr:uncharacterized protein EV422DRAFT_396023 [Fimicolochytrium jonesii]KAI8822368.1 hypothetical protein EV422DRAFT_396023 [Fimicolochytrium jonesii]
MSLVKDQTIIDGLRWRCKRAGCRKTLSVWTGSFFSRSHLSLAQALKIMYAWSQRLPHADAQHQAGVSTKTSQTTCDWYHFCREVCVMAVHAGDDGKIGGPGKTVEVDESKFGKRKFNRGKRVEGIWVFGGICREDKRSFLVPGASLPSKNVVFRSFFSLHC